MVSALAAVGADRIGLAIFFIGMMLALPITRRRRRVAGWVVSTAGALTWLGAVGGAWHVPATVLFWLLAGITIASAVAAVTMTSAIYSAIWFALMLVGVAALLVFQGSSFLGIATLVVYAGAIVVTLLFVLMLAEPRGHSTYDRLSWGRWPRITSPVLGAAIVMALTAALPSALSVPSRTDGTASAGIAELGAYLFSRHLIEVEIAGTLLLVALVGAVSIILHGRHMPADEEPVS